MNSTGTVVASTTTDSNGDYTFTNVSPGEYTLTASKIRFWSDSMSVTVNSTVTANCALWLKGDLNNNGISADARIYLLAKKKAEAEHRTVEQLINTLLNRELAKT